MKNVKLMAILIALVCVNHLINAQETRFGINAGYSYTSFNYKSTLLGIERKTNTPGHGVLIGANLDYMFLDNLGLNVGLNYNLTFTSDETDNLGLGTKYKTSYHSLQLPVRLNFEYEIGSGLVLLAYAGPKFTFDIDAIHTVYINGNKFGDSESLYKDNDNLNRFNIMVGPGVGIRYENFVVKGGYDFGLLNRWKNSKDYVAKFNQLYITIGYYL